MPDQRGVVGRAAAARLAARFGVRVILHDTVDSTMDAAGRDAGSRPVVHVAATQTAGRGRRGRLWASPPGNLYATICWPDADAVLMPGLLAAIQLAWAEAIGVAGGPDARCKWPNDGLVAGEKWAGVLAVRAKGPEGSEVRVGLGANLETPPGELGPKALPATTLAAKWPAWPGSDVVGVLLLEVALGILSEGPQENSARLARWPERDALTLGEAVRVTSEAGDEVGAYAGLAPDGRLRLDVGGDIRLLASGDVERLRKAAQQHADRLA
ncbi:MAG: biotin--[acetyl-CoA-carboxylase] ligase [Gemmatimonadota bacterium]